MKQILYSDKYRNISFFLLALFVIECSFGGEGHWLSLGAVSIRVFLFTVVFIVSLPLVLSVYRKWITNIFFIAAVVFLLYMGVCLVIGFIRGNRLSYLFADIKRLLFYAILPAFLVLIDSDKRIRMLLIFLIIVPTVLSVVIFTANVYGYLNYESAIKINAVLLSPQGIISYNPFTPQKFQIFAASNPYIIFAVLASIYYLRKVVSNLHKTALSVVIAINAMGITLNMARSTFLAAGIGILIYFLFMVVYAEGKSERFVLLKHIGIAIGLYIFITAAWFAFSGVNLFELMIERSLGMTDQYAGYNTLSITLDPETNGLTFEELQDILGREMLDSSTVEITSDEFRKLTVKKAFEVGMRSPIIGNGLGASLDGLRGDATEYYLLDLFYKTGIVGLLSFLGMICISLVKTISVFRKMNKEKQLNNPDCRLLYLFFTAYLAVFLCSLYNPYMSNALGLTIFFLMLAIYSYKLKGGGLLNDK